MAESKRVYIEGASIAGLTAAARLGKFKYQTFVNGEIYQNTKIDGFEFDTASLFTLPAVYRDFFQKTGKHFGQVLDVKPMDPAFSFTFPELTIDFANLSRSARLEEIESKLGSEAAKEWDLILKEGEYFWDRMRENYLEWEFSYLRADLNTYLRLRPKFVYNPHLRKILAHYATYLGYPAGIYKWSHILAFVEESFGIWQVNGGTGALVNAIKERALEHGTKFEECNDFDFYIDSAQTHSTPTQRLIGIKNYPSQLPVRNVQFHPDGLTTDIYSTKVSEGQYSLVLTGSLEIKDFDKYAVVDQIRSSVTGDADDQVLTKIRTTNRRRFKAQHMDSLSHAGICGELLANSVRGIKNRPSHEH